MVDLELQKEREKCKPMVVIKSVILINALSGKKPPHMSYFGRHDSPIII